LTERRHEERDREKAHYGHHARLAIESRSGAAQEQKNHSEEPRRDDHHAERGADLGSVEIGFANKIEVHARSAQRA
jgi:hypothetical protein